MAGWRARVYNEPGAYVSSVQLFGPPFTDYANGEYAYEEPRSVATWGGSLFYSYDPYHPLMFRTSQDKDLLYFWRQAFGIERDNKEVLIAEGGPLRIGDVLKPIRPGEDDNNSADNNPTLLACQLRNIFDDPSRVIRRWSSSNLVDYEKQNCTDIRLYVSSLDYVEADAPIDFSIDVSIDDSIDGTYVSPFDLSYPVAQPMIPSEPVDLALEEMLQGIQDYNIPADDDPIWDDLRQFEADAIDDGYVPTDEDVDREFQYLVENLKSMPEDELAALLAQEKELGLDALQELLNELGIS
ncbi:hypothetical protein ABW21_db0202974 [Orbilia brochopaga]|nr:hypothetical protein ABW21_db0202974 [Drechslerella brochopaga]